VILKKEGLLDPPSRGWRFFRFVLGGTTRHQIRGSQDPIATKLSFNNHLCSRLEHIRLHAFILDWDAGLSFPNRKRQGKRSHVPMDWIIGDFTRDADGFSLQRGKALL
jgi:hypothetical protein